MTTSPPYPPPSSTVADRVTCPYGHAFPTTQLTIRNGQYVCPVCDGARWAAPAPRRTWSRLLLRAPLALLALAVLLEVAVQVTTLGLGSTYANQHLGGSGWLITEAALSLVGTAAVVVGVVAVMRMLPDGRWSRQRLGGPLTVIGLGLVVNGIAGLLGLGFNLALLDVSSPGGGWQFAGQLLDSLSQVALGVVGVWIALLLRATSTERAGES